MFGIDAFMSGFVQSPGGQATALNWFTTAFNVFGATKRGREESDLYNYQAARMDEAARIEREVGQVQAGRIRTAGGRDQAKLAPHYAGAGVEVGGGTVAAVRGELDRRVELDALSAVLEGDRRAYELERGAGERRMAAGKARSDSRYAIGASVLAGASRQFEIDRWIRKDQGTNPHYGALDPMIEQWKIDAPYG